MNENLKRDKNKNRKLTSKLVILIIINQVFARQGENSCRENRRIEEDSYNI